MSKFSDTLVYLRKRAGFSQQELADKMEVSRSLVGMYESGQRMPSYEMLEALADIFNGNIDFLTGHEDSGEMSKEFREKLAHIIETRDKADLAAAGVDLYEVGLIINGAVPLSLDMACQLAEQLGESLDSMLGLDVAKSAPGIGSGLDIEIINMLISLSDDKKAEAVNYIRYLANGARK